VIIKIRKMKILQE